MAIESASLSVVPANDKDAADLQEIVLCTFAKRTIFIMQKQRSVDYAEHCTVLAVIEDL